MGDLFEGVETRTNSANYHAKEVSIREYVELKCMNMIDLLQNQIAYTYNGHAIIKDHIIGEYKIKRRKENTDPWAERLYYFRGNLDAKDYKELGKLYDELMPLILDLKIIMINIDLIQQKRNIKYTKMMICGLYFLCWSYILIISQKNYPVNFDIAKNFIINFLYYLNKNDYFSSLIISFSEINLKEYIKFLINLTYQKVFN